MLARATSACRPTRPDSCAAGADVCRSALGIWAQAFDVAWRARALARPPCAAWFGGRCSGCHLSDPSALDFLGPKIDGLIKGIDAKRGRQIRHSFFYSVLRIVCAHNTRLNSVPSRSIVTTNWDLGSGCCRFTIASQAFFLLSMGSQFRTSSPHEITGRVPGASAVGSFGQILMTELPNSRRD
jgi:hypothetical protein